MKAPVISPFRLRTSTVVGIVTMIAIVLQLSSCSNKKCCGSEFNPQDVVKTKLIANNWKMQSVLVDDLDKTSIYTGLTAQFTPATFTTTNGKAVWPANGTWSFASEDGSTIKRDDGIIIKVEVTDTTLKLTLTWPITTLSGGKLQSVKGVNVFNFVK